MAALAHERGGPVADGERVPSNAILPPEDAAIEEVEALLSVEGLIPD